MQFFSREFLLEHCQSILSFYDPVVIDSNGGYLQNFYDNGQPFNTGLKQLVSSTRLIVNYAMAGHVFKNSKYLKFAKHGLDFLEQVHWQPKSEKYAWTLLDGQPQDMTQQAYGYAFVLLAYAAAKKSGIIQSNDKLLNTYDLLESRFWLAESGLYADERDINNQLSNYRGQNANMHLCEAMIAAYEATGLAKFLKRAITIAENIAIVQADKTGGLIWEHYHPDFSPNWNYNKDDPKNLYRPWGFQPGHQTEWTKLLMMLYRHTQKDWLLDRAKSLFDRAFSIAWDDKYQGLVYGFSPEERWCDDDKYFWVQAESFAAAAMLYHVTKEAKYLTQYTDLWQYSWEHFVDHQYGAWFRLLHRDNTKYNDEKSTAGAKCDYHTLGACFEVLRVLGDKSLNQMAIE